MKLIWRNNWLSCYESPLSVIDKICYANHITQQEFHSYFSCVNNKEYLPPLTNHLDYKKIENLISHQFTSHFKSTIYNLSHCFYNGKETPEIYFCKDLYYCEICSLYGYHSLLFQSKFITECPFHQITLTNLCRACGFQLAYKLLRSQSISQCCRNCSEPILRHQDVFPNYPIYLEKDILTNAVLNFLNLEDNEVQHLQNIIYFSSNCDMAIEKLGLDFCLYIIQEKIKQESKLAISSQPISNN